MHLWSTSRKLTLLAFTFVSQLTGVWADISMAQTSMDVIKGRMVLLRATYSTTATTDPSDSTVIWNFVSNNTQLIISYTKDSMSFGSSQFEGRVGFQYQMPSFDVSLFINNTQESDSGRYVCQVIVPGGRGFTKELKLEVKVPPAVPKCSMSGKPVLKGNVTLSCSSSSGKPVPLYRWKRTSPTSEVFFSPMLNEKTGSLKLNNLSSNMSGKYMCTASNSVASETCTISLEIITSSNAGVIAGATVGAVVGFILLLICLYCLIKRRRESEDDMANEIKEDAQAPKRVSWAKSGMGSDIISKNGTLSSIASSPHHKEAPPPPLHHHHNHHSHHLNHSHHNSHQQLQQYPQRPPSDTASVITASGSTAGYRPPQRHGASTPNHFGYSDSSTLPRGQGAEAAGANGSPMPRPERYAQLPQAQALPQTYSQEQLQLQLQAGPAPPGPLPLPTSAVSAANIARMGGVPIMVPAQNQAGSLV